MSSMGRVIEPMWHVYSKVAVGILVQVMSQRQKVSVFYYLDWVVDKQVQLRIFQRPPLLRYIPPVQWP